MAKKSTARTSGPKADRTANPDRAVGNIGGVAVPKPNNPTKLPGMPNRPQGK